MIRMKSVLVFLVVIIGLAISGYWLNDGGWLQMPRIFDVPAVLGGEEQAEPQGQPPGEAGADRPAMDAGGQSSDGDGTVQFEGGAPPDGGRAHGHGSDGLNWDMLPTVLANLWIIASIIAVVVYSAKALTTLTRRIARSPAPAQA
jgi:hypothetical protein